MVALRLVRLLEKHSDEIARVLLRKLRTSPRTQALEAVTEAELLASIRDFLQHSTEWLLTKPNAEIEERSRGVGARLARQHVALADCCWSLVIVKESLWEFLQREGFLASPIELYGELELLCLLNQVFDNAVGYLIEGYEDEGHRERYVATHHVRDLHALAP